MDERQNILESFLEHIVVLKGLSKNTSDAYLNDLNQFADFLANKNIKLTDASSEDLISYLSTFSNKRTQNRHLSSINSFFDFCYEKFDLIEKPTSHSAKIPKTLPKFLTYENIINRVSLIDRSTELGLRDYAMILFLYASGLRVSELINLKNSDLSHDWLRVRFAKGSKERMVPIAQIAIVALQEYQKAKKSKTDWMWQNYKHEKISRISVFNISQKYCGVSPHVFRHSFATSLILSGADLLVVGELLGHSNITTTQIYTHIQKEHLQKTIIQNHPLGRI